MEDNIFEISVAKTGLKSHVAYLQARKLRDLRAQQAKTGKEVTPNEITLAMDQVRGRFGLGSSAEGYDYYLEVFALMDDNGHIPIAMMPAPRSKRGITKLDEKPGL